MVGLGLVVSAIMDVRFMAPDMGGSTGRSSKKGKGNNPKKPDIASTHQIAVPPPPPAAPPEVVPSIPELEIDKSMVKFSPFDIFWCPSIQEGERTYKSENPDLVASFALKGWDAAEPSPKFVLATKKQQEEGKRAFAKMIADLRNTPTKVVKLFEVPDTEKLSEQSGEPTQKAITTTCAEMADRIMLRYAPRYTYKYAAVIGQSRTKSLPIFMVAWEEFGISQTSEPRNIENFKVTGQLVIYRNELEAIEDRVRENVQLGRVQYTNEDKVGIALKMLELGSTPPQVARNFGWNYGSQQEYCDRAKLCLAYPQLDLLNRMKVNPTTGYYPDGVRKVTDQGVIDMSEEHTDKGETRNPYMAEKARVTLIPYIPFGLIPYSAIPATFCRAVIGTALDGKLHEAVARVLARAEHPYKRGTPLPWKLAEACIAEVMQATPPSKGLSKKEVLEVISTSGLTGNDPFLEGVLNAIANGDKVICLTLLKEYVADHQKEWNRRAQSEAKAASLAETTPPEVTPAEGVVVNV